MHCTMLSQEKNYFYSRLLCWIIITPYFYVLCALVDPQQRMLSTSTQPVGTSSPQQQHGMISTTPLVTADQLLALQKLAAQRAAMSGEIAAGSATDMESDEEEPSPEALMRYMAMRRHTIGVGDSEHDQPQDVRAKLAQHKPLVGTCVMCAATISTRFNSIEQLHEY